MEIDKNQPYILWHIISVEYVGRMSCEKTTQIFFSHTKQCSRPHFVKETAQCLIKTGEKIEEFLQSSTRSTSLKLPTNTETLKDNKRQRRERELGKSHKN